MLLCEWLALSSCINTSTPFTNAVALFSRLQHHMRVTDTETAYPQSYRRLSSERFRQQNGQSITTRSSTSTASLTDTQGRPMRSRPAPAAPAEAARMFDPTAFRGLRRGGRGGPCGGACAGPWPVSPCAGPSRLGWSLRTRARAETMMMMIRQGATHCVMNTKHSESFVTGAPS